MDVTTYIKKKIEECNFSLEKEYQNCPDAIKIERLESRMEAFSEVLYFLEKNAPEDTSKGK